VLEAAAPAAERRSVAIGVETHGGYDSVLEEAYFAAAAAAMGNEWMAPGRARLPGSMNRAPISCPFVASCRYVTERPSWADIGRSLGGMTETTCVTGTRVGAAGRLQGGHRRLL
jgi:hypothetical protein